MFFISSSLYLFISRMKIGIIGYGVMGEAIARSLKAAGFDVSAHDVDPERRAQAKASGLTPCETLQDLIGSTTVLLLAVKPQQAHILGPEIKGKVSDHLVISIMAGVSIDGITSLFDARRIVRTMPNTPAQIGKGLTAWIASSAVTAEDKELVTKILNAFGNSLEVSDENLMNAATAISGSGPAYLFLLAEALETSAVGLGFTPEQARTLVSETLVGSALLYASDPSISASELRNRVTSPGGTTQAAIASIDSVQYIELWKKATAAAYRRAQELAGK